tara:strand:+ start:1122 stop:1415 length:294 start_codon:yes stop_codon:yes gene_type:complete
MDNDQIDHIKIDDSVPVPVAKGKWSELAHRMKVGQSVSLPKFPVGSTQSLRSAIQRSGFQMVSAKDKDDPTKIRCWKVEGKPVQYRTLTRGNINGSS